MSTQDIVQTAVISLLAGLCWWQAGQDVSLLGYAAAKCMACRFACLWMQTVCCRAAAAGNACRPACLPCVTCMAWQCCFAPSASSCPRHADLPAVSAVLCCAVHCRARNTLGLLFFLVMLLSFRERQAAPGWSRESRGHSAAALQPFSTVPRCLIQPLTSACLLSTHAGALYNSLFTFPDEYKHMLKERASGMVRRRGADGFGVVCRARVLACLRALRPCLRFG